MSHKQNDECTDYVMDSISDIVSKVVEDNLDFDRMGAQRDKLLEFESKLGIGPIAASRLLSHSEKVTPYNTYKDWKAERNVMPGAVWVAIDLLLEKQ